VAPVVVPLPSSNEKRYSSMSPFESVEFVASNETVNGASPSVRLAERRAVGGAGSCVAVVAPDAVTVAVERTVSMPSPAVVITPSASVPSRTAVPSSEPVAVASTLPLAPVPVADAPGRAPSPQVVAVSWSSTRMAVRNSQS